MISSLIEIQIKFYPITKIKFILNEFKWKLSDVYEEICIKSNSKDDTN